MVVKPSENLLFILRHRKMKAKEKKNLQTEHFDKYLLKTPKAAKS